MSLKEMKYFDRTGACIDPAMIAEQKAIRAELLGETPGTAAPPEQPPAPIPPPAPEVSAAAENDLPGE